MIRRPPRSTLFPYNDALPIYQELGTQAEVVDALRDEGYEAVQTTVSRDIAQLGLVKRRNPAGRLVYALPGADDLTRDRKSTRLNSSHANTSYAVFCLKKKTTTMCCSSLNRTTSPPASFTSFTLSFILSSTSPLYFAPEPSPPLLRAPTFFFFGPSRTS